MSTSYATYDEINVVTTALEKLRRELYNAFNLHRLWDSAVTLNDEKDPVPVDGRLPTISFTEAKIAVEHALAQLAGLDAVVETLESKPSPAVVCFRLFQVAWAEATRHIAKAETCWAALDKSLNGQTVADVKMDAYQQAYAFCKAVAKALKQLHDAEYEVTNAVRILINWNEALKA